jgi:hypothetical protein
LGVRPRPAGSAKKRLRFCTLAHSLKNGDNADGCSDFDK